jgi:hypothetical protein
MLLSRAGTTNEGLLCAAVGGSGVLAAATHRHTAGPRRGPPRAAPGQGVVPTLWSGVGRSRSSGRAALTPSPSPRRLGEGRLPAAHRREHAGVRGSRGAPRTWDHTPQDTRPCRGGGRAVECTSGAGWGGCPEGEPVRVPARLPCLSSPARSDCCSTGAWPAGLVRPARQGRSPGGEASISRAPRASS